MSTNPIGRSVGAIEQEGVIPDASWGDQTIRQRGILFATNGLWDLKAVDGREKGKMVMSRRGVRIIPKTKNPIDQLLELSMEREWQLEGVIERDRATRESGEVTYLVPDTQTFVILRDDALTGVHYFTIWGPGEKELAEEIRGLFEYYTEDELFAWWDRGIESGDVDDKVDAVLYVGVGAPSTPHDGYWSRIRAALLDGDKDVRNAAVVAAGYADWPVFRADIERAAAADPDDVVRQRAEVVLKGWADDK